MKTQSEIELDKQVEKIAQAYTDAAKALRFVNPIASGSMLNDRRAFLVSWGYAECGCGRLHEVGRDIAEGEHFIPCPTCCSIERSIDQDFRDDRA